MADPSPEPIQTRSVEQAPPPPAADTEGGINLPLLGVLLGILLLVSVSNVWLRRRAERESRAADDEERSSPS